MLRLILFLILFYFVYRVIKIAIRFLHASEQKENLSKKSNGSTLKYKNIEDAVYTEVKPEDEQKGKDKS